ncbi:MAG: TIGR03943 family putative permease subunit [Anaerolineae bacterium]
MIQEIKLQPQSQASQEWTKALILLGLGVYFIFLIISGNLINYINLRFAWLSYVAAVLFFGLGVWSTLRLFNQRLQMVGHSNAHLPISWNGIFVVGLPLIFATMLPSQPLGADAISGSVSLNAIGGVSTEARFNIPPIERNVLDWLREFDTVTNPSELDGLPVDIIAFVYREPDLNENQFMAARFTLSCCVADAFAIGMPVETPEARDWTDGDWVRIQGTLQVDEFRGERIPIIIPTQIEPTDAPDNPYLYS